MTLRRTRALAVFCLAITGGGCKTIVVPLVGTQVGRPHASGSKFGLRLSAGSAVVPTVQDIAPEVRDPDGNVINPVPGEPVLDETTGQPRKDPANGEEIKELTTIPMPVVDLAVAFAERFELGFSTHRGTYLLWDVYRDPRYTVTLSPAFATSDVEVPENDLTISAEEDPAAPTPANEESEIAMKGHLENLNVSALGSVRFGDPYFYMLSLYGGLGLSQVRVEIEDRRTNDEKSGEQVLPTVLFGINGRLLIFDLAVESQVTSIKQRNGKSRSVASGLLTVGLKGDWY